MTILLPPQGHPAREAMGELTHVVEILAPENRAKLPDFAQALAQARAAFRANPAQVRLFVVVLHSDNDAIRLWSFGRQGGKRRVWTFREGGQA